MLDNRSQVEFNGQPSAMSERQLRVLIRNLGALEQKRHQAVATISEIGEINRHLVTTLAETAILSQYHRTAAAQMLPPAEAERLTVNSDALQALMFATAMEAARIAYAQILTNLRRHDIAKDLDARQEDLLRGFLDGLFGERRSPEGVYER